MKITGKARLVVETTSKDKADSQPTELCGTLRLSGPFEPSRLKRMSKSCDLALAFDLALQLSCLLPPKRRVQESASTAP